MTLRNNYEELKMFMAAMAEHNEDGDHNNNNFAEVIISLGEIIAFVDVASSNMYRLRYYGMGTSNDDIPNFNKDFPRSIDFIDDMAMIHETRPRGFQPRRGVTMSIVLDVVPNWGVEFLAEPKGWQYEVVEWCEDNDIPALEAWHDVEPLEEIGVRKTPMPDMRTPKERESLVTEDFGDGTVEVEAEFCEGLDPRDIVRAEDDFDIQISLKPHRTSGGSADCDVHRMQGSKMDIFYYLIDDYGYALDPSEVKRLYPELFEGKHALNYELYFEKGQVYD